MADTATSKMTSTRRKRSRVETSPDAETDRRRGRPRVDRQDENAADRRRTQIRMAQRAYRQRKESTLEELRKRVSDLTNTIELMNRHFTTFNAHMQSSGLTEEQNMELEQLSLRFAALLQGARDSTVDEALSAMTSVAAKTTPPESTSLEPEEESVSTAVPQVRNVPSWMDESAISSEANRTGPSPADLGLGYTLFTAEGDEASLDLGSPAKDVSVGALIPSSQTIFSPSKLSFEEVFFENDIATFPLLSPQPSPPRTFSFQESTFARRLHRASLERGYQLLLRPDSRPATYERAFRLSLLGRSRVKILNAIKTILDRGPHEELDYWDAPLIHIGGAGTHYPPRDAFGNLLPKRQSRNVGKIGPQTLALLDNVGREQISSDMTVEIAGYEGEWFDSGDVQGYLEEKGIFISPAATFAEADMTVDSPAQVESGESIASSLAPQTPDFEANGLRGVSLLRMADPKPWDDMFSGLPLSNVGYSDAQTGSFMNFLQPGEAIRRPTPTTGTTSSETTPAMAWADDWMDDITPANVVDTVALTPPTRTKKVVIDVRKLIKALSTSGVCLGRSPGFRRKDVDHALKLAAVDAASF